MPYGTIKIDTITFTDGGVDKSVPVSGLVQNPTFTGNITVTGTISGNIIQGGTTVSGLTVTGTTANFASGVFTTQISGVTITGTTVSTTTGNFTSLTGTTATITSGIIASGTAALPSLAILSDPNTGIYSPGADQLAISTNGVERVKFGTTNTEVVFNDTGVNYDFRIEGDTVDSLFFVDASTDRVGIGTSSPGGKLDVRDAGTTIPALGAVGTGLNVRRTDGAIGLIIGYENTIGGSYIQAQHTNGSAVAYPLYLQPNGGNVGIGTTSPTELLSVNGNLWLGNGGGSGGSEMLRIWNDSGVERIHASNNPSALAFGMGGSSSAFEAFRIDSSRRLLVGTSTTATAGNSQYSLLQVKGGSGLTAAVLSLTRAQAAASISNGSGIGSIAFGDEIGNPYAYIACESDAASGASDFPGRLVFSTTADGASSPTPRMGIYSNGTTGIFTTSAGSLFLDNSAAAGTTYDFLLGRYGATALGSGTASFRVWTNGNVVNTNNSYGAISDIKLKENIVDAGSQWDDLKALQVRKYNFKEGQTHTQIGLVAQEVELVSPGLVTESPDRDEDGNDLGTVTKSVNYSVLYMKAVKALQEAMERIETLEAKVAALETP